MHMAGSLLLLYDIFIRLCFYCFSVNTNYEVSMFNFSECTMFLYEANIHLHTLGFLSAIFN